MRELPNTADGKTNIGIIVLAAGASIRMGEPKQLLAYEGHSLLRRATEAALASLCHPVIVVLGSQAERVKSEVADCHSIITVENKLWAEGMGSSISCGLKTLELATENKVAALVLMPCDQPFVSSLVINELVAAYHRDNAAIVASEYNETLGVPALFSRRLFPELIALRGASGAKQVITRHAHIASRIPFARGILDIDTPTDYARLRDLPGSDG
ncbi:MAG: nucleotidyltransferase family protein [Pyrinomonadaceae bacterium]